MGILIYNLVPRTLSTSLFLLSSLSPSLSATRFVLRFPWIPCGRSGTLAVVVIAVAVQHARAGKTLIERDFGKNRNFHQVPPDITIAERAGAEVRERADMQLSRPVSPVPPSARENLYTPRRGKRISTDARTVETGNDYIVRVRVVARERADEGLREGINERRANACRVLRATHPL